MSLLMGQRGKEHMHATHNKPLWDYYRLLLKTSREGGFPAMDENKACYYLAPDGKKCAIGLLIPDGSDAQKFVGPTVMLFWHYPKIEKIFLTMFKAKSRSITDIQNLHDTMAQSGRPWNHTVFAKKLRNIFKGLCK